MRSEEESKIYPQGEIPESSEVEQMIGPAEEVEAAMNNEEYFVINKESYPTKLQAIYEGIEPPFKPKTLVQFAIILPFHTSIPDGVCASYQDENYIVTLCYSTVATPEIMLSGVISDKEGLAMPRYRTRVEMVFATLDEVELTADETDRNRQTITHIFDTCLNYVNELLKAYIVATKDQRVHRVTRQHLQPRALWRKINVDNWDDAGLGIFILHMEVPFAKDPLSQDDFTNLLRHAWMLKGNINPFMFASELIVNSRRYLNEGFYQEAVIYAQLSVEMTLRRLYEQLLIEGEGKTQAEVEATREDPFISIVKGAFMPRIGGNWNINDTKHQIGRWYKNTYLIRNKVIHEGYFPTFEEADEAVYAATELRYHIVPLVKKKSKKYPKLSSYFTVQNK